MVSISCRRTRTSHLVGFAAVPAGSQEITDRRVLCLQWERCQGAITRVFFGVPAAQGRNFEVVFVYVMACEQITEDLRLFARLCPIPYTVVGIGRVLS